MLHYLIAFEFKAHEMPCQTEKMPKKYQSSPNLHKVLNFQCFISTCERHKFFKKKSKIKT